MAGAPTVAILPWGNVIEDYLGAIGVSLDRFVGEMTGGWLFGYVEALRRAGVRAVIVFPSAAVRRPERLTHAATGTPMWALPSPPAYALLRRGMATPYGWDLEQSFGRRLPAWRRAEGAARRALAAYAATPPAALARVLREERCAAVLCQEYEYARFDLAVLLGRRLGVPVFATFQGGTAMPVPLERWLRPRAVRRAAGLVIAGGEEAARVQSVYGLAPDRVARVFNPVDAEAWRGGDGGAARSRLGIPAAARVVVCHGRISMHAKGLDVLVHAWSRLAADRANADRRLLLVGTGEDASAFRALLDRLGAPGVHWVNEFVLDRGAMRDYLAAGNVYVLASRREGFPVAPVEAMAAGLPVVAADAPGVADILAHGEADGGMVVRREDVDGLAAALARLLDDPPLATTLGARARRRVEEHFALDAVGRQLRDFMAARGARALAAPG